MHQRLSPRLLFISAATLAIPLLLLAGLFLLRPARAVRGKSPATPLSDALSPAQLLAQDLALADPRVQALTVGRPSEVFGVRQVGQHFPASAPECALADCRQVEIYNFDEDAAVVAFVDLDARLVREVFHQPGVQPGLNKRLADLALDIALNHPDVIAVLGFRPEAADMAPVESGLVGTACDQGHLCVGPTFELGDRILWAIVDLTDETLVGLTYTDMQPNPPRNAMGFVAGGCPDPGAVNRDSWDISYETTGTDGLRLYNVSFNGVPVITSVKALEWHADYGASGYTDYTGCGGGGGGFHINPYGPTEIRDLLDNLSNVIGFEVVQDFRMFSWGNYCNYRYEQHHQFFPDGRFRVVGGAYGKGCGSNAMYRPLLRIDLAAGGDPAGDSFALWNGGGWADQPTEAWWSQDGPYSPEGYKWRVADASGAGFFLQPGQANNFGDGGRGDDAFIYAVQHHPDEGDTDMGIIGGCCNDDYQQGPHLYLNGESIADEDLVLWYVPQFLTDASNTDGTPYYCWTVSGEPNPETYPCFGGPMFVPIEAQTAPGIAFSPASLSATLLPDGTTNASLTITNTGTTTLTWEMAEAPGGPPAALNLSLNQHATGLNQPVDIAHAGDERLFVVERPGRIRIVQPDGSLVATPFLDIQSRVRSSGGEQGLLGLAFHPDYANNGAFFVNYTNLAGDTVIARFAVTADPNLGDPASEQILLTVDQPYTNHNGGDLAFGPDGYLYVPLGDGGSSGDPGNRAQDPGELLGKMLRLDVDAGSPYAIPPDNPFVGDPSTLDEIWALGLRNPWRFAFDRLTGDLLIGDVGQYTWEEIDFQPAGSPGGENYGWRCYEGNHPFNTSGCGPIGDYVAPIFEYDHGDGCSVSGGRVYRGLEYPGMYGHYLFTDYCTGNFWSLAPDAGAWSAFSYPGLTGFGIVTFGEDRDGQLFAGNTSSGIIYRVVEGGPSDSLPWLTPGSSSGAIAPGETNLVPIAFDAAGLAVGSYAGHLVIGSNAPDSPLVDIPVNLEVSEGLRSVYVGLWGGQLPNFRLARGVVAVRDPANAPAPGATVSITWTRPNGTKIIRSAVTNASGLAWFQSVSLVAGSFTLTVDDIVQDGYLFDAKGSVLVRTIVVP